MATLNQDELIEAVREWCEKRNLPLSDDISFFAQYVKGAQSVTPDSSAGNYRFNVQVRGLEMKKQGPYR